MQRFIAYCVLIGFSCFLVVYSVPGLNRPFAVDSFDGYNGAVWSTRARSLRERGPFESKLGGNWGGGDSYADHPPLIYVATAAAQLVMRSDELAARVLALLASLSAVVLLYVLLSELGNTPALAAVSVVIGLSIPMFLVYGSMLDTLILGLPFAVGYLITWSKSFRDSANTKAIVLTAMSVSLVAWEGALLVAVTLVLSTVWHRGQWRRFARFAGFGLFAAIALDSLWIVWVRGGVQPIVEQFFLQAGRGSSASWSLFVHSQISAFERLIGLPFLAIILGMLVAIPLRRDSFRVALAVSSACVLYTLVFRQGAFVTEYWNYWFLIVLVIGVGCIADIAARLRPRWLIACASVTAAILLAVNVGMETPEARTRAQVNGKYSPETRRPVPGQSWVPLLNDGHVSTWDFPQARYYLDAPLHLVDGTEADAFILRHPAYWIVVGSSVLRGQNALAAIRRSRATALETSGR